MFLSTDSIAPKSEDFLVIQGPPEPRLFADAKFGKPAAFQALGAAEEMTDLHTIIDAVPIGITVLAPDGTTLHMNRLALDRIGITLDEVKSKGHLGRIGHPDEKRPASQKRSLVASCSSPSEGAPHAYYSS
jgi:PAS domain-containing protein